MTYQQIMDRIKELNCGDLYKLVGLLLEHYIDVVSVDINAQTITVNTEYCKDGKAYTEQETIHAGMPAIRDYLGY